MDLTAIGAVSIAMHQSQLQQSANILVLRKAMDFQTMQGASLVESFQQLTPPPSFHQLDVLA